MAYSLDNLIQSVDTRIESWKTSFLMNCQMYALFFKKGEKRKIDLIAPVTSCITLQILCVDPEIFIRLRPGPTNKVLTTFLLSSHLFCRESPIASRGGGTRTSILNETFSHL